MVDNIAIIITRSTQGNLGKDIARKTPGPWGRVGWWKMIELVNATANRIPLADNSVHCVPTSPPYWGLRDYGLPPRVWGGEEGCRHVWGDELSQHQRGQVGGNSTLDGGLQAGGDGRLQKARQGQFCQRCGAWRGCLGLEPSIELYVSHLVDVFREVRRVLHPSGTVWLNLGDSYCSIGHKKSHSGFGTTGLAGGKAQEHHPLGQENDASSLGLKHKDLCMIPARVALALQADGWWLRSQIIWHKPNCMPESVTDRPTTSHEYVFLLAKSERYFYNQEAVREPLETDPKENYPARAYVMGRGKQLSRRQSPNGAPQQDSSGGYPPANGGRNRRTVWTIPTQPYAGAHFATFPPALIEPMIKAGSSERGVCPECGGPWERVVEKPDMSQRPTRTNGAKMDTDDIHLSNNWAGTPKSAGQQYQEWRNANPDITTGWRPTCACKVFRLRDDLPDEKKNEILAELQTYRNRDIITRNHTEGAGREKELSTMRKGNQR